MEKGKNHCAFIFLITGFGVIQEVGETALILSWSLKWLKASKEAKKGIKLKRKLLINNLKKIMKQMERQGHPNLYLKWVLKN
jgi:hypothetical protein